MAGNGYSNVNVVGENGAEASSAINPVAMALAPATIARIKALATTNLTSVKAGAGSVTGFVLVNTSAALKYVKFYNKATAPVLASDVPLFTIAIPATSAVVSSTPWGFALGLAYAITNLVADDDATVVAANDVHGFVAYR